MDTDKVKRRDEGASFLKLALIPWVFYIGAGILIALLAEVVGFGIILAVMLGGLFAFLYSMGLLIYLAIDFKRLREQETTQELAIGFVLATLPFVILFFVVLFD